MNIIRIKPSCPPPSRPVAGGRPSRGLLHLIPFLVLLLLLGSSLSSEGATQSRAVVTASMVLKVTDREKAAEAIVTKLEAMEGYFSSRTDESLVVKVPVTQLEAFLAFVETQGQVVDRGYETRDVGFQLDQAHSRLAAREEVINRYFQVLKEASPNRVVTVEQQITAMVADIENYRGQLKLLEHQLEFAQVSLSFQFRDRKAPARDGRSSFRWLNSMNLADLVEDFRYVD